MKYKKPKKLNKGDTVAIISPSWGGPSLFPHVFENGLKILEKWGLKIKEMPSTRKDDKYLWANPEFRANDINNAFSDKSVKAIFTSIGGDDSVRILPFLKKEIIKKNPKILIGFSDATTLHTYCSINGLVTFYGPSIMAGFSQMESLSSEFSEHVHKILISGGSKYSYHAYDKYCEAYPDWSIVTNVGKINRLKKTSPWKLLQGSGIVEGELFGGCIEALEFMKGTEFWPKKNFWKNKILFFETSENIPPVDQVKYFLRNYGMQGIFSNLSALLFGRAMGYSKKEKKDLNDMIIKVVNKEFGLKKIPIITEMDFGHTDPKLVLPLGVRAKINCKKIEFSLSESWFS